MKYVRTIAFLMRTKLQPRTHAYPTVREARVQGKSRACSSLSYLTVQCCPNTAQLLYPVTHYLMSHLMQHYIYVVLTSSPLELAYFIYARASPQSCTIASLAPRPRGFNYYAEFFVDQVLLPQPLTQVNRTFRIRNMKGVVNKSCKGKNSNKWYK